MERLWTLDDELFVNEQDILEEDPKVPEVRYDIWGNTYLASRRYLAELDVYTGDVKNVKERYWSRSHKTRYEFYRGDEKLCVLDLKNYVKKPYLRDDLKPYYYAFSYPEISGGILAFLEPIEYAPIVKGDPEGPVQAILWIIDAESGEIIDKYRLPKASSYRLLCNGIDGKLLLGIKNVDHSYEAYLIDKKGLHRLLKYEGTEIIASLNFLISNFVTSRIIRFLKDLVAIYFNKEGDDTLKIITGYFSENETKLSEIKIKGPIGSAYLKDVYPIRPFILCLRSSGEYTFFDEDGNIITSHHSSLRHSSVGIVNHSYYYEEEVSEKLGEVKKRECNFFDFEGRLVYNFIDPSSELLTIDGDPHSSLVLVKISVKNHPLYKKDTKLSKIIDLEERSIKASFKNAYFNLAVSHGILIRWELENRQFVGYQVKEITRKARTALVSVAHKHRKRDEILNIEIKKEFFPLKLQHHKVHKFRFPSDTGLDDYWECVKIGSGGWGTVYKCSSRDKVVALKIPMGLETIIEEDAAPTIHPKILERITKEAQTIKELHHPHILKLLSSSSQIPIIVYEYADKGSLEYQLARGLRLNEHEALLLTAQLADAVRYIHSRGLIHRDLKSSNILIVNGIAKLADFSSLTKLTSQISHSKNVFTPGWRAPEQVFSDLMSKALQGGYENKIDIYQLGNLLLYILTGETVDGSERIDEKLYLDKINQVKSEKIKNILNLCMKTEPSERISAEELVGKILHII